jgi:hypothetical protein
MFSSLLFLCRIRRLLFMVYTCCILLVANPSSSERSLTSHKRSMPTSHNVTCCDPEFVFICDNRSGHIILPVMISHGCEAVASSFIGIIRSRQRHLTLDASGSHLCSNALIIVNPFFQDQREPKCKAHSHLHH